MADVRIDRRGFLAAAGSTAAGVASLVVGVRAAAAVLPGLQVGPVRRVGPDRAKHIEPWIAANPRDDSNLVVVGSSFMGEAATPSTVRMEPAAWYSVDGGATWSAGELEGAAGLRGERAYFTDAYATHAPDGTAFCVFTGSPTGDRFDLWIYRSDDGGRHWHGPTTLAGGLDYPRLAADLHGGKPRVFVVVAVAGKSPIFGETKRAGYGCAVLRSDDGARTFSAVNFLAPTTLDHDPINSPVVLPDGRLLIGFMDYPSGSTADGPRQHVTHARAYAASSRDGGATFSTPAPVCDTWRRDGFVVIAADRSNGPRRGRVYAITYSRSSRPPGLRVQTSGDGAVWSPPAAVPDLREGPIPHAAVAVSSQGVLGLVWAQGEPGDPVRPDDKAWTAREHAWDLYFTASADGGASFAPPVAMLKTSRTDPKVPRWPYGSDYISLAASADGDFHPLWVDTREGKGEIQTAKIGIQT